MREEVEKKVDNLIEIINTDSRIIALLKKKKEVYKDKELLNKLDLLRTYDKYSSEYKNLKLELFNNKEFVEFKELEQEINYLIMEINSNLKKLTNERRCLHENN